MGTFLLVVTAFIAGWFAGKRWESFIDMLLFWRKKLEDEVKKYEDKT